MGRFVHRPFVMISVASFYFCSLVSSSCHVCVHCDLLDSSQMCQVIMLPSSAPWKLVPPSRAFVITTCHAFKWDA